MAPRDSRWKRKKRSPFGPGKVGEINYKDVNLLKKFLADSGKILPARTTGASRKHQRMVTSAIRRARVMGLLPYKTTGVS